MLLVLLVRVVLAVSCIVDCKQTVFSIQDEAEGEQTERARPVWSNTSSSNTCSVSSNTGPPSQPSQPSQPVHLSRSIPITIQPAQSGPEEISQLQEGNEKENDSIKAVGETCFSPKIRTIPIEILDCEGEQKVEAMSACRTIPIQRINQRSSPNLSRTPSGETESFPSQKIKMGTSAIKIPIQVSRQKLCSVDSRVVV